MSRQKNRPSVFRNYGLGAFEVMVRLNPATQQAKINRILEEINNGYDGQFGETSWETDGEH